jgi:hypothetical protein
MNRFATLAFAGGVLAAALAAPAPAAVPSAANSTFPRCLVTCPFGDIHVVVTVRDLANNPVAGASVVFDFFDCTGAFLCPQRPNYGYDVNVGARTIRMFADAAGQADFPLHVGGVCGAGNVRLFADGVLFTSYALASPDQNGDGVVIALFGTDLPTFNAKLGTTDPTADFDCSGNVDAGDTIIFNQHVAHACDGIVLPTEHRSWGSVKQHYR